MKPGQPIFRLDSRHIAKNHPLPPADPSEAAATYPLDDSEAKGATDPAPPPEPLKVILALIFAHFSPKPIIQVSNGVYWLHGDLVLGQLL